MTIEISAELDNNALIAELRRLTPTPKLRRKILKKSARELIKRNKKRITAQKEADGKDFTPRKRGKKKMFRRVKKQLKIRNVTDNDLLLNVGNKNIAAKHYTGQTTTGSAEKNQAIREKNGFHDNKYDSASRRQAKSLIKAGYKAKVNGRKRKPTIKWIVNNLSIVQAGKILRILRGDRPRNWKIVLPSRKLLGYNDQDLNAVLNIALDLIKKNRLNLNGRWNI